MSEEFEVTGNNSKALFTMKLHRGDGMALIAMNWKKGKPPKDFVGFAIEYKEPKGDKFFTLKNRLAFPGLEGSVNPNQMSTRLSPIQKFRWVHFPRNADLPGEFTYQATPVFMDEQDVLSYGDAQQAAIVLQSETYPDELNIGFARGFRCEGARRRRRRRAPQPTSSLASPAGHTDRRAPHRRRL